MWDEGAVRCIECVYGEEKSVVPWAQSADTAFAGMLLFAIIALMHCFIPVILKFLQSYGVS